MNIQEVLLILDKAKQIGLMSLEYDGLKIYFEHGKICSDLHTFPPANFGAPVYSHGPVPTQPFMNPTQPNTFVPDSKVEDLIKQMSTLDELSPEEILYAATPYFDEIQAKKEAHQIKLNEETKQARK